MRNSPAPDGVDRAELRELVRRGLVVEQDGIHFAATAIDLAARALAVMLPEQPEGVTVAEVRNATKDEMQHGHVHGPGGHHH